MKVLIVNAYANSVTGKESFRSFKNAVTVAFSKLDLHDLSIVVRHRKRALFVFLP